MNLQKHLVGHFPLSGPYTYNGNVIDLSGRENHDTLEGGYTEDVEGPFGPTGAVSFNGTDGRFLVGAFGDHPYSDTLADNQEGTLSAWVKTSGSSGSVIGLGGGNNGLAVNVTGSEFVGGASAAGSNYSFNTGVQTDGEWHHVAIRYETDNTVRMYIDSEYTGETTINDNIKSYIRQFHLGESWGVGGIANGELLEATIADARIYKRALSHEAILGLSNMRNPRRLRL